MSEKNCRTCGKEVRSRNGVTQDECFKCRKAAGQGTTSTKSSPRSETSAPPASTDGEGPNLRRFRKVAAMVGADATTLLEEFAGTWLETVREALDGDQAEA